MTVLDCFKQASRRLLAQDQNSLFTGSDPFQIKMQTIITEAALDLAQHHDWMALTKQCTLTSDGSTADFLLPSDYDLPQRLTDLRHHHRRQDVFQRRDSRGERRRELHSEC